MPAQLQVVDKKMTSTGGVVTIESDQMDALRTKEARELVLQTAAAAGLHRPGLSNTPAPYGVDEKGNTSAELMLGRAGRVAAYRVDYKVSSMP